MQRRCAYQEVFERKLDAFRFLLAFDASRESCDVKRHRVDRNVARQPLDELKPPFLPGWRLCAIGPVHKFGDRHN